MNENQNGEDFSSRLDHCPTLSLQAVENEKRHGTICPNCGAALEGRKCKLICPRRGCGYLVTCSEW